MTYTALGGPTASLTDDDLRGGLVQALEAYAPRSRARKVIAVPPDITRFHSRAGFLTVAAADYYGDALTDVLPALGTHVPMTDGELDRMYPGLDHGLVRPHRWRSDLTTLGTVPASFVEEVSEGAVSFDWPAQVNTMIARGGYDAILSIGQVVPHEVIGFANHSKNLFVGTGGAAAIHASHFLGAAYGMERIMGRVDTPVRAVLDSAAREFAGHLPILYVLTVVSADEAGTLHVRGLFVGDDRECYEHAAALSGEVNITPVDRPFDHAVVYLDPAEFRSTWLGNKAIYRTRMAMADGGALTIIAPGVREFGEDPEIDRLIRAHGYRGTPETLAAVDRDSTLANNLSAAAHLIHGSSEGRFSVTWCPGHLSRREIEGVGYGYQSPQSAAERWGLDPATMERVATGYRTAPDGTRFFFVQNPALGLWALADRLQDGAGGAGGTGGAGGGSDPRGA